MMDRYFSRTATSSQVSLSISLSLMKTGMLLLMLEEGVLQLLKQKSTHWNPRASVRQARKSQPSVPINLTWNWQGRKQSKIQERIGWDSENLSDERIGKLCRYYGRQKDIKCRRVVKERIGRVTKRQNRLWIDDLVYMIKSKLWMCNSDDVKLKTDLNWLLR